jgi:hypothetical protein
VFWERAIRLSFNDQQIGLQSFNHVTQAIASDGSHDTTLNFDIVPGKGIGQIFQPRFDVSRLFSARRGDGRGERPFSDGNGNALRTQDFDGTTQQLMVLLLFRLEGKYDMLRRRWILQGPRHQQKIAGRIAQQLRRNLAGEGFVVHMVVRRSGD